MFVLWLLPVLWFLLNTETSLEPRRINVDNNTAQRNRDPSLPRTLVREVGAHAAHDAAEEGILLPARRSCLRLVSCALVAAFARRTCSREDRIPRC